MFKEKRLMFFKLTNMITALNSLSFSSEFDTTKLLDELIIKEKDFEYTLPSGCVGNALALALELHLFPAALYIIINSDRLKINLDVCSRHPKYGITYSACDIFDCVTKNEELCTDLLFDLKIKEAEDNIRKLLIR